jgi:uncharacterized membrane protein
MNDVLAGDIPVNAILVVKWLHVLSSTLLFGTGVGSAFYLFFVSRTRDVHAVAVVSRWVVVADWWFTATTIVFQPLSGFWLVHRMGYALTSRWIWWATGLFILAALCWLPVVWLQMRLRDVAKAADDAHTELPPAYWNYFGWWVALGVPAFVFFLAVFYLMVARPA